jgi:hypothetical protein
MKIPKKVKDKEKFGYNSAHNNYCQVLCIFPYFMHKSLFSLNTCDYYTYNFNSIT